MKCSRCKHFLPDDSVFCQYCGTKIEPATESDVKTEPEQIGITLDDEQYGFSLLEDNADIIADVIDDNKTDKVSKKTYCRVCGGAIEKDTKKCSGCGKQYFKGIRIKLLLNFVLGIIILVSLFFNVMQYISYMELEDAKDNVVSTKQGLESEVKKLKESVSAEYDKGYDAGYSSGYNKGKSQSTVVTKPSITYSYDLDADECCIIPGCNSSPQRNSFYCFRHECMDVGCHNQRANDYCSYCVNHKCAAPNCNSSQAYNSVYCYRHKN